jgi:hypothetical protein
MNQSRSFIPEEEKYDSKMKNVVNRPTNGFSGEDGLKYMKEPTVGDLANNQFGIIELSPGRRLMLCTDGATNGLNDNQLRLLGVNPGIHELAQGALRQNRDNYDEKTVIVIGTDSPTNSKTGWKETELDRSVDVPMVDVTAAVNGALKDTRGAFRPHGADFNTGIKRIRHHAYDPKAALGKTYGDVTNKDDLKRFEKKRQDRKEKWTKRRKNLGSLAVGGLRDARDALAGASVEAYKDSKYGILRLADKIHERNARQRAEDEETYEYGGIAPLFDDDYDRDPARLGDDDEDVVMTDEQRSHAVERHRGESYDRRHDASAEDDNERMTSDTETIARVAFSGLTDGPLLDEDAERFLDRFTKGRKKGIHRK